METQNLRDFALFCECADQVSRFNILVDFMKKAVNDFYTLKSKKEKLAPEDMDVFMDKYRELQELVNNAVIEKQ